MTDFSLLTEEEAAERLRCTIERIVDLMNSGDLAYMEGPPALILERTLNDYIERTLINHKRDRHVEKLPIGREEQRLLNLDRRYDEVFEILEEICTKNGNVLRITPAVRALLDEVKDAPKAIASRKKSQRWLLNYQNWQAGYKANGEKRKIKTAKQAAAETKKRVKAAYKRKLAKQATEAKAAGSLPITKRAEAARRRRLAAKRRTDAERHHANKSPSGSS